MYYFALKQDDNFIWKVRETFFLQNIMRVLSSSDNIRYKTRTDFVITYNWTEYEIEIGWKNKSRKDVFVAKDNILLAEENVIPLWLFGFLE